MAAQFPLHRRSALRILTALALLYAFCAGLRTIARADLGWQLATGRWIATHHSIPSTDVFSYTAAGHEWIYPALSSLFFYVCHGIGGFGLLSWIGAIACTATIALLLRRAGIAAIWIAIVAVPVIAQRTAPRAEMFTILLFAAFVVFLWREHREQDAPLWLLPVLMLIWVNLHPGFIAGLAMCAAYVVLRIGDAASPGSRGSILAGTRKPWIWFAATAFATLINPWGWRIYSALMAQERAASTHSLMLVEWAPLRITAGTVRQFFAWRNPDSAVLWLIAIAIIAIAIHSWRTRIGSAAVLAVATWMTLRHSRYDALFAILVVVIGGAAICDLVASLRGRNGKAHSDATVNRPPLGPAVVLVLATLLVGIRTYDLVSNRVYLAAGNGSIFGAGSSSTYPTGAAKFILKSNLPPQLMNDYSSGGYWLWALGERYPDFVDGRALPFGSLIEHAQALLTSIPPDSPEWQHEADSRGINIVAVGLALNNFPLLPQFCHAQNWTPVYLDAWSAVFLRNTPQNAALASRLRVDCATAPIVAPAFAMSSRERVERFFTLDSGARILHLLGRDEEALRALDDASAIFSASPDVELQRGAVLFSLRRTNDAEDALHRSIAIHPTEQNNSVLGQFYTLTGHLTAAVAAYERAASLAPYPHSLYFAIAQLQLRLHNPKAALAAADRAEHSAAFPDAESTDAHRFRADIAELRASIYFQSGDSAAAVQSEQQATQLDGNNPARWRNFAAVLQASGRSDEAQKAQQRAAELSH